MMPFLKRGREREREKESVSVEMTASRESVLSPPRQGWARCVDCASRGTGGTGSRGAKRSSSAFPSALCDAWSTRPARALRVNSRVDRDATASRAHFEGINACASACASALRGHEGGHPVRAVENKARGAERRGGDWDLQQWGRLACCLSPVIA